MVTAHVSSKIKASWIFFRRGNNDRGENSFCTGVEQRRRITTDRKCYTRKHKEGHKVWHQNISRATPREEYFELNREFPGSLPATSRMRKYLNEWLGHLNQSFNPLTDRFNYFNNRFGDFHERFGQFNNWYPHFNEPFGNLSEQFGHLIWRTIESFNSSTRSLE